MILVTGATGSIGRNLVRELTEQRTAFRAFVRDAERGRALGSAFAVGNFEDPTSIEQALNGIKRVFLCSPGAQPVSGPQPMIAHETAVIEAAMRAGVRQVVKVSVWGAHPGGLLAEGAHAEIEARLEASGLDWSILQPSGFMQNFRTGAGAFTAEGNIIGAYGDAGVSYIDCADIAASAATLLTTDQGSRERFVVTGPQVLTHTQIAAELSAALGRSVAYVDMKPREFAEHLVTQGLPAQFAADVAVLHTEVASGTQAATTTAVADLTGRQPARFTDYLARAGQPLPR